MSDQFQERRVSDRHLDLMERTITMVQTGMSALQTQQAVTQTTISDHIAICNERQKIVSTDLTTIKRQIWWVLTTVLIGTFAVIAFLLVHGLPWQATPVH